MSPFHVNHRVRLAEVIAALNAARHENRHADAQALELAARVLANHLGETDSRLAVA
jgi:hypothetical protein